MAKPTKHKLTPKQAKFIDEYLIDLNATQAAIRAGYSKKTAKVIGYENLTKPYIAEKIQENRDELKERAKIDQEWVLDRYKLLAAYRIEDFFGDDGTMKPLSEIPKDALYAIQGVEVDTRTTRYGKKTEIKSFIQKFKLPDKRATLDSIAKLLGLVVERVSATVGVHNYGDMTDEEILEMLKTLRKRNES